MPRWNEQARKAQSERMKRLHEEGKVSGGPKRSKATTANDEAVRALRKIVKDKSAMPEQIIRASHALARLTGERAWAADENVDLTPADIEAGVVLLLAHPWPEDVLAELLEWVRAVLVVGSAPPIEPERVERIASAARRMHERRRERAAHSDPLVATVNRLLDRDLNLALDRAYQELAV